MLLAGKDYRLGNMVCNSQYRIVWERKDHKVPRNRYIIKSNASTIDIDSSSQFEYRIFKYVETKEDNPSLYTPKISKNHENILERISKMNCNFYSKDKEVANNAKNDILDFCNDYGLLMSRAYFEYLNDTQFLTVPPTKFHKSIPFPHLNDESIELNVFIYLISKIRALSHAYTIYHKLSKLDPSTAYVDSNVNLIFCLKTLLTLLLPNESVFNIEKTTTLLDRIWNIKYLKDFFYEEYYNCYLKFIDWPVLPEFIHNPDPSIVFGPMYAHRGIAENLYALYEAISSEIYKFQLNGDCSFILSYPADISTYPQKDRYQKTIISSLTKHASELVELLGHTALCVLNSELKNIKTFMYLDNTNSKSFHIGYQCVSLYEELILEIASMYINNTALAKCARYDCEVLFSTAKYPNKMYCCSSWQGTASDRRRTATKKTSPPDEN